MPRFHMGYGCGPGCSTTHPGKAAEDGPRALASAPLWETPKKLLVLAWPSRARSSHLGSDPGFQIQVNLKNRQSTYCLGLVSAKGLNLTPYSWGPCPTRSAMEFHCRTGGGCSRPGSLDAGREGFAAAGQVLLSCLVGRLVGHWWLGPRCCALLTPVLAGVSQRGGLGE